MAKGVAVGCSSYRSDCSFGEAWWGLTHNVQCWRGSVAEELGSQMLDTLTGGMTVQDLENIKIDNEFICVHFIQHMCYNSSFYLTHVYSGYHRKMNDMQRVNEYWKTQRLASATYRATL